VQARGELSGGTRTLAQQDAQRLHLGDSQAIRRGRCLLEQRGLGGIDLTQDLEPTDQLLSASVFRQRHIFAPKLLRY
jgi:hypothetical protein